MEEDGIVFIKQLLLKFEKNIDKLEKAKENNEPRKFNELKKESFDIHKEIAGLLQ